MTKRFKKIVPLLVAITMLLSVFVFVGCDANNLTLTQEVNAVDEQVTYLQNGGTATNYELDELLAELARLRAEVERLEGDNAALLQRISGYEAELMELRDNKETARLSADFVLNITVSTTTLQHGQNLTMDAVFKNQSGEQVEISGSSGWVMPSIANWYSPDDIRLTIIESDATVAFSWQVGSHLSRGRHTVVAAATFGTLQRDNGNVISSQSFVIKSNTITITVA